MTRGGLLDFDLDDDYNEEIDEHYSKWDKL